MGNETVRSINDSKEIFVVKSKLGKELFLECLYLSSKMPDEEPSGFFFEGTKKIKQEDQKKKMESAKTRWSTTMEDKYPRLKGESWSVCVLPESRGNLKDPSITLKMFVELNRDQAIICVISDPDLV